MVVNPQSLRDLGARIARAALRRDLPAVKHCLDQLLTARDQQWTAAVVGEGQPVMEPGEAAEWLAKARRRLVAEVVDATRFKGQPKHY
jgi:hypothetical protein